jgi:hypothetical protein
MEFMVDASRDDSESILIDLIPEFLLASDDDDDDDNAENASTALMARGMSNRC